MAKIYQGTINGMKGNWLSGIGYLLIDGKAIPCENATTVRALARCYDDVIGSTHSVNEKAIIGKEIVYQLDDLGMLNGFAPASDYDGPTIPTEGLETGEENNVEI